MLSYQPKLLIFILFAALLVTIHAQDDDEMVDDCSYLECSPFSSIVLKEVNGVQIYFSPCCMQCTSCANDYDPVCLSSGDTFKTYRNVCQACLTDDTGLISSIPCPGAEGIDTEEEESGQTQEDEGELGGNEELGLIEEDGGMEINLDDWIITNE